MCGLSHAWRICSGRSLQWLPVQSPPPFAVLPAHERICRFIERGNINDKVPVDLLARMRETTGKALADGPAVLTRVRSANFGFGFGRMSGAQPQSEGRWICAAVVSWARCFASLRASSHPFGAVRPL